MNHQNKKGDTAMSTLIEKIQGQYSAFEMNRQIATSVHAGTLLALTVALILYDDTIPAPLSEVTTMLADDLFAQMSDKDSELFYMQLTSMLDQVFEVENKQQ